MLPRLSQDFGLVAAATVLFAVGGCQNMGASSGANPFSGNAQQQLSAMLAEYSQALMKKDMAALDRIWGDDLTFVNLRGELLNKQNRMDNVRTGATAFKSIQMSEKQIRTHGDLAVATAKVVLEAQYSGQEGSGD